MKKNRKGLVIAGLLALCVIMTVGVFTLGQSPKIIDGVMINTDGNSQDVTPGGIAQSAPTPEKPADITIPDIQPGVINPIEETPRDSAGTVQSGNEIILTAIEDKPEPPELPETAHHCGDDCEEHSTPPTITDPVLTNPDKKPDGSPIPAATPQPQTPSPQSGDKKDGQMYVPGFGWIKDEGGGSQGTQSQLDPNYTDFDKMVGH